MKITSKLAGKLILVGYVVVVFLLVFLWVQWRAQDEKVDLGVECVKLMYQFEIPAELVKNQSALKDVLTSEEFERLQIDEEMRTINAYFKFKYSSSRVSIVESEDGYVLYTLVNDHISPTQYWVFLYDVTEDGKLTNIREYRTSGGTETEGIR